MIALETVSKSFGEKTVLQSQTLHFQKGESVCILGASGCGKSTLLKVASGLLPPDNGKVKNLSHFRSSYLFQEDRLLPWANCIDNITYTGASKETARAYLSLVKLAAEEHKLPGELSGGMRRRLAIARALAFGGDCFFFDEPLQGLDINTNQDMVALIKKELHGKTALIITHSADDAFAFADRIIIAKGIPFTALRDCKADTFHSGDDIAEFIQNIPEKDNR